MKHADYRSFESDDLHMEYSSPEDEEALLPGVRTTIPPTRSLKRTVITGVVIVATIVCSGFLVSLSTGSSAKSSSKNGASMLQSVQIGNYIYHNKFIAKVKPNLALLFLNGTIHI